MIGFDSTTGKSSADWPSITTVVSVEPFNSIGWRSLVLTTTILASLAVVDVQAANLSSDTLRPFGSIRNEGAKFRDYIVEPQATNWLAENVGAHAPDLLSKQREQISQVFGGVSVGIHLHQDPEENWMKPIVTIESNLGDDFDTQFALEEKFFSLIWQSEEMRTLVKTLVIRQA